jgi:hypothetical protein
MKSGPLRMYLVHDLGIGGRLFQPVRRHRPLEDLADAAVRSSFWSPGRRLIGRNARLRAEEEVVHRLRREAGRALAQDACHRRVQVAVATEDAQRLHASRARIRHE